MAIDITNELNNIKSATYGEQVRGSIHDGIKKIADEVEASGSVVVRRALTEKVYSSDTSVQYNVGDYVMYPNADTGALYICQTATTGGQETFPGGKWLKVGLADEITNHVEYNNYRFDSANGPEILAGKSCDDLVKSSVWFVNKIDGVSTLTDFPIDGPGWIRVTVTNDNRVMQEVYPSNIDDFPYRLFRTKNARNVDGTSGVAWSDWYKTPLEADAYNFIKNDLASFMRSSGSQTVSGITFTFSSYGSFHAAGTSSATVKTYLYDNPTGFPPSLSAGTVVVPYISSDKVKFNICEYRGSTSNYVVLGSVTKNPYTNYAPITLSSSATGFRCEIEIESGVTIDEDINAHIWIGHISDFILDFITPATMSVDVEGTGLIFGNGVGERIVYELPNDEQTYEAVSNWLDEHPEATTIQDGSLTYKKLVNGTLGFVTPEMFGAVGDGATDDTTAISQAFASGLNVQFKNGATYNISGALAITNPIAIYGNGATIKQTSPRTNAIVASGVSSITISDLCIIGYGNDYAGKGGQIAPYGIKISGTLENHVSNIVIQNCVVKYCTWCGIDVYCADNVIIEGNTVVGTGVQDLEYESNYQFGIDFGYGTDIKVLSNTVSETAQGLYIGQKLKNAVISNNVIKDIRGQHGCYATSGTNFEFSNNILSNIAMEGIKMQLDANTEENAKNGIIAFNVFSGIGSFAIHTVNLTDNGYVVENYAINDNVIDNSANGVYITSGKDIVVKNNTIVNSNYGIRFRYMSAGSLTLENNFIKNIQNNGIAQYSGDATAVKDLIIKNNVLKECGQAGTGTGYAVMMKLDNLSISGKFIIDGNYISDENNLSHRAAIIYAQSTEGLVFINNHTKDKSVYLYQGVKEFNNNVCEGGLTISQSLYSGRKTRTYTGTVSDLPANTSGYSNGDMFYFTDVTTSGYAMAVLQDGVWAMLGKLDDYVIHPFIDTHSASRCTINSVSITSSGDELTISMSITVLIRGSETLIGNFKAKSSLLPSAKTEIYANNISVYLTTLGYLSISGGVANTTYDFTVKFVNGVLQSS